MQKEFLNGNNQIYDIAKRYYLSSLADLKKIIQAVQKLIPSELKEDEKETAKFINVLGGIYSIHIYFIERIFQFAFSNEANGKKKGLNAERKDAARNTLVISSSYCNYLAIDIFNLYQYTYRFFLNTNGEKEKKELMEQIKNLSNSYNGLLAIFNTLNGDTKEIKNNQKQSLKDTKEIKENQKQNHEQVVKLVENRNEEEKPKRLEIAKCATDIYKILKNEYKTVVKKKTIEKYLRRFDTALEEGKKIALPSYKYAMFFNQEHFIVWTRETFIPYYLQHRKIKVKNKTPRHSSSDAAFDEAARQRYKETEEENDSY